MNKTLRIVALIVVIVAALVVCIGCSDAHPQTGNRVIYGADVQTFHYAYVYLGSHKIAEGYVEQWRDYENSEAVQVKIDGRYYLTEYTNVVLVSDPSIGWTAYSDVDFWYNVEE